MNIEPVFQEADERSGQTAGDDTRNEDQRLCRRGRQVFIVTDQDGGREPGDQHLSGDADIEQAGLESNDERQGCQQHRSQIVQKVRQVREHAAAAAVICLRDEAAALQETDERRCRTLSHEQKQHARRHDRQDNSQYGNPDGRVFPGQIPRQEMVVLFHASFTPII